MRKLLDLIVQQAIAEPHVELTLTPATQPITNDSKS